MKEIITLLKKDILISYGFIFNIKAIWKSKKHRRSLIFNAIGIIVLFAYLGFIYKKVGSFKSDNFYNTIYNVGMFITIFNLIAGMSMIISKLHINDDLKILLRLPVKTKSIILVNIINLVIGFMFINIVIMYPLLVISYINSSIGVQTLILGIIGGVVLLLFNISVIMIVSILIISLVNKMPRVLKKVLQLLGMILFVLVIMGMSVGYQFFINGDIEKGLGKNDASVFNYVLPQLKLFANSIAGDKLYECLISLFILTGVSIILILFIIKFLSKSLIKTLIDQKTADKKIKLGKNNKKSIMGHLIKIEFLSVFKNMSYVFNLVLMVYMLPIIFIIGIIIVKIKVTPDDWNQFMLSLKMFFDSIGFGSTFGIGLGVAFVLSYYSSGLQPITSTSISRHKETIWLMQSLPIKAEKYLRAKLLFGLLLNIVNLPIFIAFSVYLLGFNTAIIAGLTIGSIVAYLFALNTGLIVDVINPKLDWTEPIKAVKNNPNLFITMILCYAIIFGYGYVFYKLFISNAIDATFDLQKFFNIIKNFGLYTCVVAVIFSLLSVGMYISSVAIYKKRLKKY